MTDQPGHALDEAFKLLDAVRRRMFDDRTPGDVWSEAVREERPADVCPHGCPVCRTVEAAKASGPEVLGHVVDAGQSLFAAFQDVLAGYERSRAARPGGRDAAGHADREPRGGGSGTGGEDPLDIG
jgi:hypothetical protein